MVESKQYKKSLQNLENKIGDKNVSPFFLINKSSSSSKKKL